MNLDSYKENYPRLEDRLSKLEIKNRMAELMLELKDHAGMKKLLSELETIVNSINTHLLTPERLETEEREKLMTDKERCMWLADVFNAQAQIIKTTNNYLKKL
jgi:predicted nucleic acid-binding protein